MGRRRALSAVSVAGLAVVLTGCMKMDVDFTINEDDTVDGEMIVGIDRGLAEMSGDTDAMIEDMLAQEDIPEGASAERYEDDDYLGTRYIFDGQDLEVFGSGDATGETLSIVREGDEFVVSGTMDLSDATGENMGDMGGLGEGMLDSFDLRIAFTFPGEIIETTGEVDGNTVVWEPAAGEVLDISARASAEPGGIGGLPIWAWVLIGVVVLAALVGLFFVVRRSNKTDKEPEAPGYAGAPHAAPQYGQEQHAADPQQSGSPATGFGAPAQAPPAPPAPAADPGQPAGSEPAGLDAEEPVPGSDEPTAPPAPEPPTTAEPNVDPNAGSQDVDSDESPEQPRPRDV